jgi:hypothetical protein
MSTVVSWLVAFGKFWYRFIVGDDWTLAVAVIAGLAITDLLNNRGITAWWLVPLIVVGAVGISLLRRSPIGPANPPQTSRVNPHV